MSSIEFFLYLIYGYAMITMGLFAVRQKDIKVINLSLVKSLKYLGYFGIIHGISEWMIMIIKLDLDPELFFYLSNISQILRAFAFAFLLYFGLDLLPLRKKYKRIVAKLPVIYLLIYMACFFHLFIISLFSGTLNIILLYDLLGFPSCSLSAISLYIITWISCLVSAIALYVNAWMTEKTKSFKIATRYRNLAWVLIVFGLLEGLLVTKADFFPASVINKELFVEQFSLTPLFIRAFIGFVIYFLLIKVIDTFSWEQEEKLNQLEKLTIAAEERIKLGQGIHDSIIRELHEVGSKIQCLFDKKSEDDRKLLLQEIRTDLNKTISKTRDFISTNALDKIELENLKDNLEQLIHNFNNSQKAKISLEYRISPYMVGYLSPEKSTLIYYIIQEAISNIIMLSEADNVDILLEGRFDSLYITLMDNGKGISLENLNSENKIGISSMQERTKTAGGTLSIEKLKRGTRIELRIPWEEPKDDE